MSSAGEFSSRRDVARAWSQAVTPTAEIPLPQDLITECLCGHVDTIVEALLQEPFSSQTVLEAATALVAQGIGGEQALGRTIEVLGQVLPRLPELSGLYGLADKVPSVLGAIAIGFAAAVRRRGFADRQAWFREVFASAPVGMVVSRLDGTITETNGALTGILHYRPAELTGHTLAGLFDPDDAASLQVGYKSLLDGTRERLHRRTKMRTGRGDTTGVALTVSVLRDASGNPKRHLTTVEDIADQALLEQRVRHQSLHDLLTGLPNRLHFGTYLEELLERHRSSPVTLYKIDLDCFGVVTDGLGIGIGDLLLISVADRLQSLVADEKAFVARFDADEFAIVIEESPTTPDAATLAARINAELSEPVYIGGRGLAVSACIGVVRRTAGETDAMELIRAAEATLHRAERTGRGQWGIYDPIADAQERARYALATDMPGAWEDGEVTVSYQPLVRIDPAAADAGRTVALAALLCWEHPQHGVVSHEDGLALAERTGLVLKLGPWLLQCACEHLRSWRDQLGPAVPPVRVDLTAYLTQHPDLVAVVHDTLAATQLAPQDIQLGMPVEAIVAGHGDAVDNIRTLAEIGVCIVLTRYGQAVGNLVLLETLQVKGVELAGSLVQIATTKPDSVLRPALASLVPLIRRTGAAVVVADIDDAEQVYWWRAIGADAARGGAFAEPAPPEDIPTLLR
ncbi:MAG: putative bifunctional diguanylate cyclase/phosphodiesterase [Pseudonocardiaceae bacterium]